MKIYSILLCLSFLTCSDNEINNEFILEGAFSGNNTSFLILSYFDVDENIVNDTIFITNAKFSTKGFINGATMVSLQGNFKFINEDDSNEINFFLEPKKIFLTINEIEFKEAVITGSITQEEFEYSLQKAKPFYSEIEPLMLKRNEIMEKLNVGEGDYLLLKEEIEVITDEWNIILEKIGNQRKKFAIEHPNSYLSAFWIDKFYFRDLPLDSAEFYYHSFSLKVQTSIYGKELKLKIEKSQTKSKIGDRAPNFILDDLLGKEINLESFKGKYVLLDFWASWCGPCRSANPDLKQLYKLYHSKSFEIIGISSDFKKESWKQAIEKDGTSIWHQVFSGNKRTSIDAEYNIKAIPAYILIDKEGKIIGRYLNADTEQKDLKDLEKKLQELLGNE